MKLSFLAGCSGVSPKPETPAQTMERLRDAARAKGLSFQITCGYVPQRWCNAEAWDKNFTSLEALHTWHWLKGASDPQSAAKELIDALDQAPNWAPVGYDDWDSGVQQ